MQALGQSSLGGQGYVDLSVKGAAPKHLGAGILYGVPNDAAYTPDKAPVLPSDLFNGAGINVVRAGGAQIKAYPGFVSSLEGYKGRFNSTLQNYRYARAHGAQFVLLPHDLWGADSFNAAAKVYPCDNGNCDLYGKFLDQLISDLKSNDMLFGMHIDIWNEPDIQGFWPRSQDQWIQQYNYAYRKYRAALGPQVLLQGPTTSSQPNSGNVWWQKFGANIKANPDVQPDIYSFHQLQGRKAANCGNDPVVSVQGLEDVKKAHGLPDRPVQINEYAGSDEQTPAYSAWFLERFERSGAWGQRANWGMWHGLHNDMAKLVGGADQGAFYKLGDWHVYHYYTQVQRGVVARAGATGSNCYDLYATQEPDSGLIHILAGTRGQTGAYPVVVSSLGSVAAFKGKTSLRVLVNEIPYNGGGRVDGPVTVSHADVAVVDDKLTVNLDMKLDSAYTIDISVPPAAAAR
ncbi:uncharacterized protein PFL1_03995 [Pseudozyma flocculosa PF-1]|nr:uncharacterized protein PFL1_03995 [Pseudozyma flocculosa PF-1]EPQ28692.1 hypothetical protein PFL1_03995 [Pseudozyma flocculosa PF-1]